MTVQQLREILQDLEAAGAGDTEIYAADFDTMEFEQTTGLDVLRGRIEISTEADT